MKRQVYIGLIAVAVLCTRHQRAFGMDDTSRAAARTMVNDGIALFREGNFEAARAKFMGAFGVAKVPTVAFWTGQTNEKMGKLVAAAEFYQQALLMESNELWVGSVQQQAQQQAKEALAELKPKIPSLKIQLSEPGVTDADISIDEASVPLALLGSGLPLDPGSHRLVLRRGGSSTNATVTLSQAESRTVTLQVPASGAPVASVAPSAPPPDSSGPFASPKAAGPASPAIATDTQSPQNQSNSQRTWGTAAVGAGVGLAVVGSIAGVVAWNKRKGMKTECPLDVCPNSTFQSRIDSYDTYRYLSTTGIIGGAAFAALGITLIVTSPKQETTRTSLFLGPNSVHVQGAF